MLCVDDHHLVREAVVCLIEQDPSLVVVAEGASSAGALAAFADAMPDVTVVGLRLRGMSGLETIRDIRRVHPCARIVVVMAVEGDELLCRALNAGAAGYVSKHASSSDLRRVIREVQRGAWVAPRAIERKRLRRSTSLLSPREAEVLESLSLGVRTKGVASALRITDHTVRVHVKNIYKKLGVHDRAAAVSEGLRQGWVVPHYSAVGAVRAAEGHVASVAALRPEPAGSDLRPDLEAQ